MKKVLLMLLICLMTVPAQATNVLRGSPHALAAQNIEANREHLTRVKTEKQLKVFKRKKILVPLPAGKNVKVDKRLPPRYRYVRPQTMRFLMTLGRDYERKFHQSLQVNSAVRTAEYQKELRRVNGNAAKADSGLRQTSHTTGATVDIAKKGMSPAELLWMRQRLTRLEKAGQIEATEENRQPVFHVMVFNVPKKDGNHRQG